MDDDARDDAPAMADREPKPFHRCPWYLQDHCRKCSYLPEDGEEGEE